MTNSQHELIGFGADFYQIRKGFTFRIAGSLETIVLRPVNDDVQVTKLVDDPQGHSTREMETEVTFADIVTETALLNNAVLDETAVRSVTCGFILEHANAQLKVARQQLEVQQQIVSQAESTYLDTWTRLYGGDR